MNIIKFDFNEMVTLQGNQVVTTSLKVAEYFNKRHDNIGMSTLFSTKKCGHTNLCHQYWFDRSESSFYH